jgi:hypothetical protein
MSSSVQRLDQRLHDPRLDSWQRPDLSLLRNVQTGSGAHPASYSMRTGPPPGRQAATEFDVDPSPPRSAEVKDEWSYTSTPPICLHGADKNNSLLQ